ncbi:MAG TPA: hypothetical protein VH138_11570, partial [Vicinamibacterales bacterium]|nr:hypothetical protein [Vicinamibacterales bacterium]
MSKLPRPPLGPAGAQVTDTASASRNRILRALPPQDRSRLNEALRPVRFELGDVMYEPGQRTAHLYFPTTAVVSGLYTTEDGETAEMGL